MFHLDRWITSRKAWCQATHRDCPQSLASRAAFRPPRARSSCCRSVGQLLTHHHASRPAQSLEGGACPEPARRGCWRACRRAPLAAASARGSHFRYISVLIRGAHQLRELRTISNQYKTRLENPLTLNAALTCKIPNQYKTAVFNVAPFSPPWTCRENYASPFSPGRSAISAATLSISAQQQARSRQIPRLHDFSHSSLRGNARLI
jgi:hypothetical protein